MSFNGIGGGLANGFAGGFVGANPRPTPDLRLFLLLTV
jgi:hypothetical protein